MTGFAQVVAATALCCLAAVPPRIAASQEADWMAGLGKRIETAQAESYLLPRVTDVSEYSDNTLWQLEQRLRTIADPCVAAVEMALFLDARRFETSLSASLEAYESPGVMALEIVHAWVVPDKVGQGTSILDDLFAAGGQVFSPIGKLKNAADTWTIFQNHFVGSVESESGKWAYEAWRDAQGKGLTPEEMVIRQRALQEESATHLAEVEAAKESLDAEMMRVDLAHGQAQLEIEARYEAAVEKIRFEAGGNALRLEEPAFVIKLANAKNAYTAEWGAELASYEEAQRQVIKTQSERMHAALMTISRLQVQRQTLQKIAVPVADNDCEGIGKLPEPVLKSGATPLEEIIALPHDRLLRVLKVLGVNTSDDFLNCLCRTAAYGSSGTQQIYHPDTWGDYDKRYSCQHPGDPCIVSGFGCLRHPLPSNSEIWESCAAAHVIEGGAPLTKQITDAVKERADRKKASAPIKKLQ